MQDLFRKLLNYAVMAPSSHNTQPWLFRLVEDGVEILADRTRALPVADPEDRELTMSCGALLYHVRLGMRVHGVADKVERVPEPEAHPDLLARVRAAGKHETTAAEKALFEAIPGRHTYRLPFEMRNVPGSVMDDLRAACEEEGARFHVVADEQRQAMAQLVMEGDRRQGADKRFRRELASWLHNNRTHSHDGIPGYAMGASEWASYVTPFVVRTFDWGTVQAIDDRKLMEGSPVLAVIATEHDATRSWLHAGEALARVLLRAQQEGLSASYLNQPIEVEDLRPKVANLLGVSSSPQLLLRIGYGQTERSTPRRAAAQLILS